MNMRLRNELNGEVPTRLKPWQAGKQPFELALQVLRVNRAGARFTGSAVPSRSECWRLCGNCTGRIACATKRGRPVIVILVLLAALQISAAMTASATTLERMS